MIAQLLKLADGAGHVGFFHALDMSPVGFAVVADADGDPPVPVAVLSFVDRARAVRRAGSLLAFTWHGVWVSSQAAQHEAP